MHIRNSLIATFAGMLAASTCAQSAPLDLKSSIADAPAENASVATTPAAEDAVAADAATPATRDPVPSAFVYADANPRNRAPAAPPCDDATYNDPQVHGSVAAGIVGGNHVSGNYQDAVVSVSKTLGSCDNPSGDVNVSIGVSKGNYNDSRHGRRRGW